MLGLIFFAVIDAWRRQDLDGESKAVFKKEIIRELRLDLGGLTTDKLARKIGLAPFTTERLLQELQRDGIATSHTTSAHLPVWRLKGLSPGRSYSAA